MTVTVTESPECICSHEILQTYNSRSILDSVSRAKETPNLEGRRHTAGLPAGSSEKSVLLF